jgi:aldehyde:ferredoxin oxidoreductase
MKAIRSREIKKYGCFSCPIRCGGHVSLSDGPYKIEKMHKPEYETINAFGPMLLIDDVHVIFKLNDMVNRGGIDSVSCGGVLAFAIECFENGLITKEDTGGLELRWGAGEAAIELTRMIIDREGLGDTLADGVKKAAERIGKGAEQYAVHCGGVEVPMHDPKFDWGLGFTYGGEPAPGRHSVSCKQFLDMQGLGKKFNRARTYPAPKKGEKAGPYDKKAHRIAVGSLYKMLIDCTGACLFGTQVGGNIPLCEWMNAATGWKLANDDYLERCERVALLRHAYNIREGIDPKRDFRPHPRVYGDPPLKEGPLKNITLDLDAMAESYHKANRWDLKTGAPDLNRLKELGLNEVIEVLYPGAI